MNETNEHAFGLQIKLHRTTSKPLAADARRLVYLRVSQTNNCAYCLDAHTHDLPRKGQSVEKLALVQAS